MSVEVLRRMVGRWVRERRDTRRPMGVEAEAVEYNGGISIWYCSLKRKLIDGERDPTDRRATAGARLSK